MASGRWSAMKLHDVLSGIRLKSPLPARLESSEIAGLEYDSRKVGPGYLFFAFPGAKVDGRIFAEQAMKKGAAATVSELEAPQDFDGPWIQVEHGRKALAAAAKTFYGAPDEQLGVTGITGTNGKTTTSFLIDSILQTAGRTTALIGTIEYHLAGRKLPAANTTPESLDVFRIFRELLDAGGQNATMEASSHGLELGRAYAIRFHTAVFTNLTRDHLDFHGTMDAYFAAKRLLFAPRGTPAPQWAVLNADDEYARRIDPPASTRTLWYGFGDTAEYRAQNVEFSFEGLRFYLNAQGKRFPIASPLTGRHNVYNILAAICTGVTYDIDMGTIARGIAECRSVPGRFERVNLGQPFLVVVDYAHTDDALRNLIAVARGLKPKRVITLFGCGGDRDRSKRPLMGMAAAQNSDFVVLTSDNPRSEDPLAIINDALVGLRRFDTPHVIEPDRAKAIRIALQRADPGDIVLLAGKGHEPYQVLSDRTIHFDDRETAAEILRGFGYGAGGQ
jgi:UDP-N-acetylmuramoyl-L-alanyl-D-glutamate--2,6-diaminopimelate ligase